MRRQSLYLLSLVFLMGCTANQPVVKSHSPDQHYETLPLTIVEETQEFALDDIEALPSSKHLDDNRSVKHGDSKQKNLNHPKSNINKASAKIAKKTSRPKQKKPKSKVVNNKPKKHLKPSRSKPKIEKVTSSSNAKILIGSVESVRIIPGNRVVKARVDTGAKTTSLHALNMQVFERDGREYVRFNLSKEKDALTIERPIWKWVRIKRHGKKSQRRPVIKLRLVLGNNDQLVAVTLTDRTKFKHPVLIGRNFLRDIYIVDVAQENTCTPKEYRK